ncbi:hypothetical protein ACH36K_11265 [Clostridium sp. MB05]|uniref:hypothetical protein n=1 Tax=Clostridium sp. MB05 TaxID=3376682 RepID=UPI0039826D75
MLENRCFCEKCNKIQSIEVNSYMETKDFNIGKITYEKLYGNCSVCGSEVYSSDLSKKNKDKLNKKIKELEDEVTILKILESNKNGELRLKKGDKELLNEIENILSNKNKK